MRALGLKVSKKKGGVEESYNFNGYYDRVEAEGLGLWHFH